MCVSFKSDRWNDSTKFLKKNIVYEPSGADGTSPSKDKIGCHMTNIVSGDRQGGITLLEDLILPTFCLV